MKLESPKDSTHALMNMMDIIAISKGGREGNRKANPTHRI